MDIVEYVFSEVAQLPKEHIQAYILGLEYELMHSPNAMKADDLPPKHVFSPGLYARELSMPKGAVIIVDDSGGTPRTISTDVNSFELEQDAGAIEVTGFGNGSKNYIPGMPVYGVTLNVIFDSTATTGAWTVLKSIFNSATSKTVSITPEAGGETLSGEFMLDALPVKGTPDGVLEIGSVHFSVMGAVAPSWA